MTNATGLAVPKGSDRTISSASTIAGDQVSEKANYSSGGEDESRANNLQEKLDDVSSTVADDVSDDTEYPSGIKMVFIVVALVMSVFLLSLDMVSRAFNCPLLPQTCRNTTDTFTCRPLLPPPFLKSPTSSRVLIK